MTRESAKSHVPGHTSWLSLRRLTRRDLAEPDFIDAHLACDGEDVSACRIRDVHAEVVMPIFGATRTHSAGTVALALRPEVHVERPAVRYDVDLINWSAARLTTSSCAQ